uniref:Uncharacterized protein n=1 Tax=Anguilla anguilla TaxID=7936 RepID=A0A0E9R515_ANGAN
MPMLSSAGENTKRAVTSLTAKVC